MRIPLLALSLCHSDSFFLFLLAKLTHELRIRHGYHENNLHLFNGQRVTSVQAVTRRLFNCFTQ